MKHGYGIKSTETGRIVLARPGSTEQDWQQYRDDMARRDTARLGCDCSAKYQVVPVIFTVRGVAERNSKPCSDCDGSGRAGDVRKPCLYCGGTGRVGGDV